MAIVVTAETPWGTIVVEAEDDSVQVAVLQGGRQIEIVDADKNWTLRVDQGEYRLELRGGDDKFQLDQETVTVSRDGEALRHGDPLGLLIYDGPEAVRHSMRLKAYRRAQQDVEYLILLREKLGLSRRGLAEFIDRHVNLVCTASTSPIEPAARIEGSPGDSDSPKS